MASKSNRNRRRGASRNASRAQSPGPASGDDRYQKYLPEWMKGADGAPARPRPARPRRARQQRPAGGYTPGKFALGDRLG